jgi:hypothetical protein
MHGAMSALGVVAAVGVGVTALVRQHDDVAGVLTACHTHAPAAGSMCCHVGWAQGVLCQTVKGLEQDAPTAGCPENALVDPTMKWYWMLWVNAVCILSAWTTLLHAHVVVCLATADVRHFLL